MTLHIVRLGSARGASEGLRVGTVRRPPRGVPRSQYAARGFYDVWFPNLAPSAALLKEAFPVRDDAGWHLFRRRFLAEMREAGPARDLDLLAALSHHTDLSVGCYCQDASRCHRTILAELLARRGALMA